MGNIAGNVKPDDIQALIAYAMQIMQGVIMVAMCFTTIIKPRNTAAPTKIPAIEGSITQVIAIRLSGKHKNNYNLLGCNGGLRAVCPAVRY